MKDSLHGSRYVGQHISYRDRLIGMGATYSNEDAGCFHFRELCCAHYVGGCTSAQRAGHGFGSWVGVHLLPPCPLPMLAPSLGCGRPGIILAGCGKGDHDQARCFEKGGGMEGQAPWQRNLQELCLLWMYL